MLPSGSTDLSCIPSTNHHGTPLSIGTMSVSGQISFAAPCAAAASAVAFTATTRMSAGPSNRVSSAVFFASPASLSSIRSSAPRLVSAITLLPASASLAATHPPIAPAPTTQMFMGAPMG